MAGDFQAVNGQEILLPGRRFVFNRDNSIRNAGLSALMQVKLLKRASISFRDAHDYVGSEW